MKDLNLFKNHLTPTLVGVIFYIELILYKKTVGGI